MEIIKNKSFDEERALYGKHDILLENCSFDGIKDGESACKECQNVQVKQSYCNLRYPFWHNKKLLIDSTTLSENCRAAIWYSKSINIDNSNLLGIKALRECQNVKINNCKINSPEFAWSSKNLVLTNSNAESEYFMLRCENFKLNNFFLNGKYSFQYVKNGLIENSKFETKDAFWHAKNIIIKDSILNGEYLAWYSKNLTLINCSITGTQPFCYCKNLKLINCKMINTDLSFEKSQVHATIINKMDSIKNPYKGKIIVKDVKEIIIDDKRAKAKIIKKKEAF